MASCINGIRVLDLSRHQAGPRCSMMLGDLGAEVIKVERPGGEETRRSGPFVNNQSVYFSAYNRGKKSICLDLRCSEGREVFFDLLRTADIVVENFKPGTLERMALGYEELVKVKPDIILVRVSGFGQTGPYRDRPGFDPVGQAMSGLMTLTGTGTTDGKPVGTAFSLIDRMTALHATIGALAALRHRDETGTGQVVDTCLMDVALTTTEIPTSYFLSTRTVGGEEGRPAYEAKDGWVVIAAGANEKMQRALAETVGSNRDGTGTGTAEKAGASYFGVRIPELMAWCRHRTVSEICEHFLALGVPVAPVLTIPEVAKDPHLWQRKMLIRTEDPVAGQMFLPGLSIKFSKTPGTTGRVPMPGEHSMEILTDLLHYSGEKIDALKSRSVI
ncbi:MAG: CaiB/BaiF CoA transferase family protein [Lautropia sp.]